MPCTIRQLKSGQLFPVAYEASSLAEGNAFEPSDGVYTVANTVNTYDVLKLTAHLDRLNDSARRAGINFTLSHKQIRDALRQVIDIAGYGDVRFRVTVPSDTPDEPIISVEPFAGQTPSLYTQGIRVVTAPNSARPNAETKYTGWMHDRKVLESHLPPGVVDAILLDADGNMLEGTTSNFYAILRDTLYTAIEGVLPGIAQQVVFEVAPSVLPLVRRPVNVRDLPDLKEAFITSSSRGIVPVVEIDGQILGDGKPGPVTQRLRASYLEWVDDHLETL